MPKIIVSSALTFLDTTDHNQLSAYLTSNFATVQTCTSDREVYSPSWADTPLEIQLHAFYDGVEMAEEKLIGKVTWYYKDGNQDQVKIENNNTAYSTSVAKLTVKENVLKTCESDTITFLCEVKLNDVDVMTVQMTYTLISDTKSVSFYLGMPDGDTFTNQEGTRAIIAYAYHGVEEIKASTAEEIEAETGGTIDSDTATFTWYQYDTNGNWIPDEDDVTNDNPKELIVQGRTVINVASFKCVMKYKGVEYIGVATVRDISDTYISEIFTIGGDVFKNGIGGSAAYVIVRKNGQAVDPSGSSEAQVANEVDPLKGPISSINAKPAYKEGGFWYGIDDDNDRIIHYCCRSNSGPWEPMPSGETIEQDLVYEWTLMDKYGNPKNFYNRERTKTGKVIYVSCNDIEDTGTVQCAVSQKQIKE